MFLLLIWKLRDDNLRPRQFKELAEFMRQESVPDHPILLLGDLNTYGMLEYQKDPTSQYSQLMRELNAARLNGGVIDVWPHLMGEARGGTTEQKSSEVGKRIDYIIVANPSPAAIQLKPLKIEVKLYQDDKVGALSDHNAVMAEFEWPETPSRPSSEKSKKN